MDSKHDESSRLYYNTSTFTKNLTDTCVIWILKGHTMSKKKKKKNCCVGSKKGSLIQAKACYSEETFAHQLTFLPPKLSIPTLLYPKCWCFCHWIYTRDLVCLANLNIVIFINRSSEIAKNAMVTCLESEVSKLPERDCDSRSAASCDPLASYELHLVSTVSALFAISGTTTRADHGIWAWDTWSTHARKSFHTPLVLSIKHPHGIPMLYAWATQR